MAASGRNFSDFANSLSFVKPPGEDARQLIPKNTRETSARNSNTALFIPSPASSGANAVDSGGRFSGFVHKGFVAAKQGLQSVRTSTTSALDSAQDRVEQTTLSFNRYLYFGLCATAGCFFIFLSFMFLPLVVLAPQKFSMLFTLGSLFLVNSLGLLKGYPALASHLLERKRIFFSVGYILSIFLTLYATLGAHSYIMTVASAALQLFFLFTFLMSYLAGGDRTLSMVKAVTVGMFRRAFGRGGEMLPL